MLFVSQIFSQMLNRERFGFYFKLESTYYSAFTEEKIIETLKINTKIFTVIVSKYKMNYFLDSAL